MAGQEIEVIRKTSAGLLSSGFGVQTDGGRTIDVGMVMPFVSLDALTMIVEERRNRLSDLLRAGEHSWASKMPMTYKAYCRVVKSGEEKRGAFEEDFFLEKVFDIDRHEPNLTGYAAYLCDVDDELGDLITREFSLPLPAVERLRHTYVVGSTGSGKTELLKILLHNEVTAEAGSVVVLDAHSDFCEQVARWPEFGQSSRLVYITPAGVHGMMPTINPLQLPTNAPKGAKEKISNRLAEVVGEISRGTGGADMSVRMVTVAKVAIRLLLDQPDSTLRDLDDLLGPSPSSLLLKAGKEHSDEGVRTFFTRDWNAPDYQNSKNAIRARLSNLLTLEIFREMTCGPNTVPLYDLIDDGKVVLFSLGDAGEDAGQVIGKLVVSMIGALGDMRMSSGSSRKPLHFFVDECQNFTGPAMKTILTGMRKYGIHLTLAHQFVTQLDTGTRDTVLGNAGVKILGRSDLAPTMLAAIGCDDDEGRKNARKLTNGIFLVKWGGAPAFLMKARRDLADASRNMSGSQWIATQARLRRYYRPVITSITENRKKALTGQQDAYRDID